MIIDGMHLSQWRACSWWPEGHEARINAGYAGHDREIVVVIDPYDIDEQIPREVSAALAHLLAGWKVANRSTRIELHPTGRFAGGFTDTDVTQAAEALATLGLNVTAVQVHR